MLFTLISAVLVNINCVNTNQALIWCTFCTSFFYLRENAGVLALTRVASRRVAQISAGFMILFSVVGNILNPLVLISPNLNKNCIISFSKVLQINLLKYNLPTHLL